MHDHRWETENGETTAYRRSDDDGRLLQRFAVFFLAIQDLSELPVKLRAKVCAVIEWAAAHIKFA